MVAHAPPSYAVWIARCETPTAFFLADLPDRELENTPAWPANTGLLVGTGHDGADGVLLVFQPCESRSALRKLTRPILTLEAPRVVVKMQAPRAARSYVTVADFLVPAAYFAVLGEATAEELAQVAPLVS